MSDLNRARPETWPERDGIDLERETPISLADAAEAVPTVGGRKPSTSTVWRWCRFGIRGVRLEYIRVGRRMATSKEALSRFMNRVAEADAVGVTSGPRRRTDKARERAHGRAEAELDAAGF